MKGKLSAILDVYSERMYEVAENSVLELGNRVVEGTPVDTGRAKKGWTPSGSLRYTGIYRFTNNIEYIIPLEYGHSDQAPNGMLRTNVRNWSGIVRANARALQT